MTPKKLLLTLSLILSCGLITGGIVYAQSAVEAQEPNVLTVPQEPGSTLGGREFSFFLEGGSFLGVHTEEINKENMQRYGLREVRGVGVTEIVKDSPAERAGLRKDDVIVRFEGDSVTSVRKLSRLVSEVAPEHSVRLTIVRGGSEQELSVTLTRRKNSENVFGTIMPPGIFNTPRGGMKIDPKIQIDPDFEGFTFAFGGNRRIGISTQPLTKQLADYFGVNEGALLITSVTENSPAAKAGLKAGDILTAVDGEKVESSGDVARAINKKEEGDVTLTVVRDRNTRTINVTPEKKPERTIVRPSGTSARRVVLPRIELPVIPEINIQLPRIVLPTIPEIEVTVPRVVKGKRVVI